MHPWGGGFLWMTVVRRQVQAWVRVGLSFSAAGPALASVITVQEAHGGGGGGGGGPSCLFQGCRLPPALSSALSYKADPCPSFPMFFLRSASLGTRLSQLAMQRG